jgi:RNA polymerase sigma factor (sigma-70 family)
MNPHSGDNPDRQEVELVSHEPNPLDVVCMAEQKIALLQKLNTLTPRQKEVLALRLDDRKLSTRDIAERLGVSQTAVMKTLRLIEKKFPARGVSIDATE